MPGMFGVSKLGKRRSGNYRSNWLKSYKRDVQLLGGKCERCGTRENLQRHHGLFKSAHGGPDNLINMVLLCESCHRRLHKLRR